MIGFMLILLLALFVIVALIIGSEGATIQKIFLATVLLGGVAYQIIGGIG